MALVAMIISAACPSLSTVAFQSSTNNRIIPPSLLGFEALHCTINAATMFFFGAGAFVSFSGVGPFLLQVTVMVGMCLILYGWPLSGKYGNLQLMLLVGVIIGTSAKAIYYPPESSDIGNPVAYAGCAFTWQGGRKLAHGARA